MWLYVNIRHLFLSNYRTFFSIPFQGCSTSNGIPQLFFFLMWECLNFSLILEGRFTCSIMVAKAVIFITLHYYNAVLLSYSLYCALDLCSLVITHCRLVHLNNLSPTPTFHAVPGHHHSALCFYFKFVIFRFHICDIIKYLGFPDVSFKHKVLKVHPWGCKRQDILSHVRIIFHCVYISHIVLNLFILNWKIIPLHYCVGFDQISTWISHRFTCVPSLLNIPPIPLPIPLF